MHVLIAFLDWFLHLDRVLGSFIEHYGGTTYGILFLIIFGETGLVVAPLLPGDSLLFGAGSFAALGSLKLSILLPLLITAAFLGDTFNYWVGRAFGLRLFYRLEGKIVKREYLERTERFYQHHGSRTIVFARFMPIIRTMAPFVAGVARMPYATFLVYNLLGGVAWVTLFLLGGYFFGTIPAVKQNFTFVILAIIGISFVPMVRQALLAKRHKKHHQMS